MTAQLYRHYNAAGELLYVGTAICAVRRLSEHSSRAPWFAQIATIKIEHFENEAEARSAETRSIHEENPRYNKLGIVPTRYRKFPEAKALQVYLEQNGISRTEFAKRIGVSQASVSQWILGHSGMSADRAVDIERKCGGAITAEDLRPDIFRKAT